MSNINEENNVNICLDKNEKSWNENSYDAWVSRFGTPKEAACKIKQCPIKKISALIDYFGDVKGKKIMNLMGSNGIKAVSLAILGADVTVVDFSQDNKRYAEELAYEAGVKIKYILSDVLKLNDESLHSSFDIVFAEMGIIHYFSDLHPFMKTANSLLKKDGTFILRDFHPVSTKLISSRGSTAKVRKHKVTGDYFDNSLIEKSVSYSKYSSDIEEKVYLRYWTIGEIVTSAAESGLTIKKLSEEPNSSSDVFDKGIPKVFTLVSTK